MARVVRERTVDGGDVEAVLRPRDDVVLERALGQGRFEAVEGPMREYRRVVAVEHLRSGRARVVERVDFRLAIPYFGFLFVPAFKWVLARPSRGPDHQPWWAPPERFDPRSASVLGTVAALSVVAGYLGTLLTQTVTFAADDFGAGEGAQGVAGFAVRVGGMLAFLVVIQADRRGRRPVLLAAAVLGCMAAASGALAPSLPWLTASQVVSRSFATALLITIGITAAEEVPAGSRAYTIGLLAMASALGAGACVLALPLADLGDGGWRVIYLLPLLGLVVVRGAARYLPESRRFQAPHVETAMAGHGRRFWLLAVSAFLSNVFVAPASFFLNRYLDTERGFSAGRISLLTIATNTPGGIGILVGGRLADLRGRRPVGAVALGVGTLSTVLFFVSSGWPLWAWSVVGALVGAAAVPALGVYGPELFPTSLRGRANGLIAAFGLAGSGVGLLTAGFVADSTGEFGPVMSILALGPLALAVVVLLAYPETSRRELEELNPEDRPGVPEAEEPRPSP